MQKIIEWMISISIEIVINALFIVGGVLIIIGAFTSSLLGLGLLIGGGIITALAAYMKYK